MKPKLKPFAKGLFIFIGLIIAMSLAVIFKTLYLYLVY